MCVCGRRAVLFTFFRIRFAILQHTRVGSGHLPLQHQDNAANLVLGLSVGRGVGAPRAARSADHLEAVRSLQPLGPPSSFASPSNKRRNIEQSQGSSVLGAVCLDIVSMVQQHHLPQHRPTGGAVEFISAYEFATQSRNGVRRIYECILMHRNPEVRRGLCAVVLTMTCDIVCPLFVCVCDHAVDVLELVLAESYGTDGFITLRFEQLSFSQLSKTCEMGVFLHRYIRATR